MSERGAWPARLAPLGLVALLAVALLAGPVGGLRLASPAGGPAEDVRAVLDGVPDDGLVLVGFDPDLGTYAEVRPTVRALLADLLDRRLRLALVSLTPEGRALAMAEAERLAGDRVVDLGFVPGGEAALVALAAGLGPQPRPGLAASIAEPLSGEAVTLAIVVGGNDLGPRSWVEQVAPRVEGLALVAVAPSVLLPELRPYLASGQLAALLGTPRDGAAYRAMVEPRTGAADGVVEDERGTALAVGLGMLVAAGWLAAGLSRRVTGVGRRGADGEEPA